MNVLPPCITCGLFELEKGISSPTGPDNDPCLSGCCHADGIYDDPWGKKGKDLPLVINIVTGEAWIDGSVKISVDCGGFEKSKLC